MTCTLLVAVCVHRGLAALTNPISRLHKCRSVVAWPDWHQRARWPVIRRVRLWESCVLTVAVTAFGPMVSAVPAAVCPAVQFLAPRPDLARGDTIVKLRMHIPDTIVFSGDEPPMWLFTNGRGEVDV